MFNSTETRSSALARLGESDTRDLSLLAGPFPPTPRVGPQPSRDLDAEISQRYSPTPSQDDSAVCLWRNCHDSRYAIATTKEKLFEHVYSAHIQMILGGGFYCKWEGCTDKDFGYGNPNALRHHILEKHLQPNFSICFHPECDGRFTSTADRMKHMNEVHRHPKHTDNWDVGEGNRVKKSSRHNLEDSVKTTPRGKSAQLYPDQGEFPTRPPYTAHLTNLSIDTTERDIREFFEDLQIAKLGTIMDDKVRRLGRSAFVDFATQLELRKLFSDSYDNRCLKGNRLIISIAKPRKLSWCPCHSCCEPR